MLTFIDGEPLKARLLLQGSNKLLNSSGFEAEYVLKIVLFFLPHLSLNVLINKVLSKRNECTFALSRLIFRLFRLTLILLYETR